MIPLFATTLFVSAALLFSIQPLFAKIGLPRLGRAPIVWNACIFAVATSAPLPQRRFSARVESGRRESPAARR